MAELFNKQAYSELFNKHAKEYVEIRPNYPPELFQFIASKTHPNQDLVWDVGTGSGQAALSLAQIYKNVVATDTSQQQLSFAPKLPNIRYKQTPAKMTIQELEATVAKQGTVDVVTVAQALHWFDFTNFYEQVNWVLRKPHGVLAVWCYTAPKVDDDVDIVFSRLYKDSEPYWSPPRKLVDDKYSTIDFPFKPVDGTNNTGPFEFVTKRSLDLDMFLTYIRSWSVYQTALSKGVELLNEEVIDEFKRAWGGNPETKKDVQHPIYLRIGRVANS